MRSLKPNLRSKIISIFMGLSITFSGHALADDESASMPHAEHSSANAPSSKTLQLPEVIRLASERYPLILAALADVDAARGEATAAQGGFDPIWRTSGTLAPLGGYTNFRADTSVEQPTSLWGMSLFAGYRLSSEKDSFPVYDQKLGTNAFGEVRAGVRVPLLRDGPIDRRRASLARAELSVKIAEWTAEQQRLEVIRLASHRYWDWVAAGKRAAIARAWLNLAERRDTDLQTRAASGDIASIDRTENQRAILQRRSAVLAFERAFAEAENELALFLRDEQGSLIPLGAYKPPSDLPSLGDSSTLDAQSAERRALNSRPELPKLGAQREQAEIERNWAQNQRLPAIDVVLSGSKDFGPGDAKWDKPALEASIYIDIPLLARVAQGRARAAAGTAARLEQQEKLSRDRIAADVRNALVAVRTAKERARLSQDELSVATTLEQAEYEKFRAGESTLLLVNVREQATAEAGLRRIDALADYHKSMANYQAAIAAKPNSAP